MRSTYHPPISRRAMHLRQAAACAAIVALAAIAAPTTHTAHAQSNDPIPAWVKTIFVYYANDQITGAEIISALEYLIAQDVIHIPATAERDTVAERAAERAAAERAAERAAASINNAIELSNAAEAALAEAALAETAVDKATSPSAIRQNTARADAAARAADEAARAADEAITEASEAATEASEAARAAGIDTTTADSRARTTASIRAAADNIIRTNELATEAKEHAKYIDTFRANTPSINREIINAISEATKAAADGAYTAHQIAAYTTYGKISLLDSDSFDERVAEAAEAAEAAEDAEARAAEARATAKAAEAEAAGAAEASPAAAWAVAKAAEAAEAEDEAAEAEYEAKITARHAKRAECHHEAGFTDAEIKSAEAAEAAGHFVSATTALTTLAKDVIDDNASVSAITNIQTSIDIGIEILNSIDAIRTADKCIP